MEEKKYIVYKHTAPNGKVYIGITKQEIKERWKNGNGYKGAFFYNAIKKYGWDNITHEVLFEGLTKEQAEQKEIELITLYKSNQREYGYNIANGGSVNCGFHLSEEVKKILSVKCKNNNAKYWLGKNLSEEHRKKISEVQKGKILKEETKKKISISLKGKNKSEIAKENMSKSKKGILLTEEHKKKLSIAKIGKKLSNETKMKMANSHKDKKYKPMSEEGKKNIKDAQIGKPKPYKYKKVIQLSKNGSFIRIFESIKKASQVVGVRSSDIVAVCKGRQKTAKGFIWKYSEVVANG